MSKSPDNSKDAKPEKADDEKKKSKKPKGPLRLEAIIPFFIFVFLIATYGHFFFDKHLKGFFELVGSYTYGAEVNIADLDIDLFNARLQIDGIEITDIDRVERNILQINQMRFKMNVDALLRAKFVISDAAIDGIGLHTPRQTPGKIYREKSETKSALKGVESRALENSKQQLAGNVFGDAASLLSGTDPTSQLKDIESGLATKKKIDEIQAQLDQKKAYWEKRIAELPNQDKIKTYETRFKKLNFKSKNPLEVAAAIKEGGKIIRQAEREIGTIKSDGDKLKADLKYFEGSIKEIEKAKEADIASLQQRISLPELDTKSLALALFGDDIKSYVAQFEKYYGLLKEYMPEDDPTTTSSASSSPVIAPKERALGKTYEFPTEKSYPLFWLQNASISSDSKNSSYSGDIKGSARDFTSNPKHLDKPAVIELAGDFPHQQISGFKADITLDKTKEKTINSLKASIARFPIAEKDFSKSADATFGFKKAAGQSQVSGTLIDGQLNMKVKNTFREIEYKVASKSKEMLRVLNGVANDVSQVNVNAHLTGAWKAPNVSLSTNLATAIRNSLQKQLNQRITEAKAKLRNMVDEKVAGQKKKLEEELNKFKSKSSGEINKVKKQLEDGKNKITGDLEKKKKEKSSKLENKAKDEIKNLFKKLKF